MDLNTDECMKKDPLVHNYLLNNKSVNRIDFATDLCVIFEDFRFVNILTSLQGQTG